MQMRPVIIKGFSGWFFNFSTMGEFHFAGVFAGGAPRVSATTYVWGEKDADAAREGTCNHKKFSWVGFFSRLGDSHFAGVFVCGGGEKRGVGERKDLTGFHYDLCMIRMWRKLFVYVTTLMPFPPLSPTLPFFSRGASGMLRKRDIRSEGGEE